MELEAAVWAVVGPYVPHVAGLLLAVAVLASVYITLLEGLRVDRWAIFRRKGVMRGLNDVQD